MDLKNRAQGTIEYLVILAVIVVVSLIVVGLLVESTSFVGGVSEGISSIKTLSAPLAISQITMNPDGNIFLALVNNFGENIDISSITIGDDTNNYSQRISNGGNQGFILPSTGTCVVDQPVALVIAIVYESDNGLQKRQVYGDAVTIPCEDTEITSSVATAIS